MSNIIVDRSGFVETKFIIKDKNSFDVVRTQDIEAIMEANKRDRIEGDGWTENRDMRHVARIPLIVLEQWAKEAGLKPFCQEMTEVIRRKLNDPDNAFFRTGGGQI